MENKNYRRWVNVSVGGLDEFFINAKQLKDSKERNGRIKLAYENAHEIYEGALRQINKMESELKRAESVLLKISIETKLEVARSDIMNLAALMNRMASYEIPSLNLYNERGFYVQSSEKSKGPRKTGNIFF